MTLTEQLSARDCLTAEQLNWYAIYTRSRYEKIVDHALKLREIESFLPLRNIQSQWKDRRKWIQKPLFPGYLFIHMQLRELGRVRIIRGVVQVVGNGFEAAPVPDEQIQAVRQMVEGPYQVEAWPWLKKGRRVRVIVGPLAGLETYIVERKEKGTVHLVVNIDILGRSLAVEIDPSCVEPIY